MLRWSLAKVAQGSARRNVQPMTVHHKFVVRPISSCCMSLSSQCLDRHSWLCKHIARESSLQKTAERYGEINWLDSKGQQRIRKSFCIQIKHSFWLLGSVAIILFSEFRKKKSRSPCARKFSIRVSGIRKRLSGKFSKLFDLRTSESSHIILQNFCIIPYNFRIISKGIWPHNPPLR